MTRSGWWRVRLSFLRAAAALAQTVAAGARVGAVGARFALEHAATTRTRVRAGRTGHALRDATTAGTRIRACRVRVADEDAAPDTVARVDATSAIAPGNTSATRTVIGACRTALAADGTASVHAVQAARRSVSLAPTTNAGHVVHVLEGGTRHELRDERSFVLGTGETCVVASGNGRTRRRRVADLHRRSI